MELARRLRAARVLSGKEVRELAAEVGLSERALYRLEKAVRVPSALELEAIARATGQPIEFFFESSLAAADTEDGRGTLKPSPEAVKDAFPADGEAIGKRVRQGARR